jgi:hypothetical protein
MALIKGKQIDVAPNGIDTANINDGAVDTDQLATDAVETDKIADGAVDTDQIAANAVTDAKVDSTIIVAAGTNAFTGDQDMGGNLITGLGAPVNPNDAARKAYVDAAVAGLDWKDSVVVRAQGNIDLSAPGATIDGVSMSVDDRFLADLQSTGSQDGIYLWKGAATPAVRSDDAQAGDSFAGAAVFVEEGTDADSGYVCTNNQGADVVGTDDLVFSQFTGAEVITAGDGLTKTGSTLNVVGGLGITANADDIEVDYEDTPGNLSTIDAGDTAASGSNNTAARGDHQHAVNTGAAGDAAVGDTAAEGTSTDLARADHQHGIPKGSPLSVGTSNSDGTSGNFADAEHVHASPKPIIGQKNLTASATASDGDQAMSTTVSNTPALDSDVEVRVNGVHYYVGNGITTNCDCYFSGDAGSTARNIADIVSGDTLHWNGSYVGFELETSDRIDLVYLAF